MPRKKIETVPAPIPPKPPTRTKSTRTKSARDKITRAQAIKLFCIECMGYNRHFVKSCTNEHCPLWPYRTGFGQQHTDAAIHVPKEWPKDKLATETPPEDDR
jgi:hypothetical protein